MQLLTNPPAATRVSESEDEKYARESKQEWLRLARITGYLTGAGFQMAAVVGVLTLGGSWLDSKLGWSGPLTIVGGVLGFGLSLWLLVRTLKKLQAND